MHDLWSFIDRLFFHRSASWQLLITAENALDEAKLAPEIGEFFQKIRLDLGSTPPTTGDEARQLVHFPSSVPIKTFIQKTGFRYRLKNSTYLFEIAKYQQFPGSNSRSERANKTEPRTITTWGASFFNEEWDMILGQNAHLSIGEAGSWSPSLNTFFPKDIRTLTSGPDAGFHDFLTEVGKVAELLDLKRD